MIISEIKIKHLKVRISEFEDLIFDKNILPIFTTPSILKEVDERKLNKYKIETLNPQKKLTFKVVSFNEIIEELTYKINKIAIDLEPFYYTDPSDFNSLNNKIKEILSKNKLIEDKINIKNAKARINKSTINKKKLILYAKKIAILNKNFAGGGFRTKNYRYNKYKFNYNRIKMNSNYIFDIIKKIIDVRNKNKKINLNNLKLNFKFIRRPNIFKFRYLNLEYINLFNKNYYINNLILFSGLIPTSKGALMLLEDNGWDLDLLSNRNHITQRINKLRPYKLRMLRRLRRLRRLRLINTNLFLHRSFNVEKIIKDQYNQGRNLSILNLVHQNNSIAAATQTPQEQPNIIKKNDLQKNLPSLLSYNQVTHNSTVHNFYFFKHTDNKLKFIID